MAEATAQGPQRLVEYLGPALRWCGLEPAGMASLLSSSRKPLRANVASVVHVAAGGGAVERTSRKTPGTQMRQSVPH